MKTISTIICFSLSVHLGAQNVGINTTGAAPHASAILDISSTSKGMLIPRMSASQRTSISGPATGLRVYDTNTNNFWFYNGTAWVQETGGTGDNGLTNNLNEIDLGGFLNQSTTISQGIHNMVFNLSSSGDFHIQDNGVDHLTVLDNGTTRFGGDVEWRDENTTGTLLAQMMDDDNDGRFIIRENGGTSVDLDANTQFVFNEQGFDRDFRIESDGSAIMFFIDAGTDRIGVNTAAPLNVFDVNGKISVSQSGAGDDMVIINSDTWQHASGNQDFGDGGDHFIMASLEGSGESAGIYGDGDHVTIWSAGDGAPGQPGALLYICDEDSYNGDGIPHDDSATRAYLNISGNWVAPSDRNRKTNIKPLTDVLEGLLKIRTYSYDFKLSEAEKEKGDTPAHALGVIAQEVEEIFPDVVEKSESGSYYVSYTEFIPILIQALKEQQQKIDQLTNDNKELQELKAELLSLKRDLETLKQK